MDVRALASWLIGAAFVACMACASAPPPPPHAAEEHEEHEPPPEEDPSPEGGTEIVAAERSRDASTASYDEALSTPEQLDVHDDRAHLTDGQLTGPMRSVLNGCRVPSNARVTIKTAVQNGRAIGVTVNVRFERPKSAKRPPTRYQLRAEAKLSAKIVTCADRAVRAITWPPSKRRDSFTTEF